MFTFPRASNHCLLALAPGLRAAENVEAVRRGGIVPQGAVVEGQPHIVCRGIAALRLTATRNTCTDFIPTNRRTASTCAFRAAACSLFQRAIPLARIRPRTHRNAERNLSACHLGCHCQVGLPPVLFIHCAALKTAASAPGIVPQPTRPAAARARAASRKCNGPKA